MPYGAVPGGLTGLLARALSRLNFPALHGAGEAIQGGWNPDIGGGVARGLNELDLANVVDAGRAVRGAVPSLNDIRSSPELEMITRPFHEIHDLIEGPIAPILNTEEYRNPPTSQVATAGPMASQVDPGMSMGIETYPEQPITLGSEEMEQVPWVMGDQGLAPEPPASPLAAMLGEQRDYDAEVEKWRQMQLGQFLMRAGAGMGSAPLGDVSGGFARAGAGVADFMADQPSQEQYRASLEQEDMAQDFATVKLAKAMEDLNSPNSTRIIQAAISQLPRGQQREAMLRWQLGDGDGLALALGLSSGEIKTVTVDGVSVQTRTGLDGTPEFRHFGTDEWIKGNDPSFPQKTTDAYQRSTPGIRRATDKDYAAQNQGNPLSLLEEDQAETVGYNDMFDAEQQEAQEIFRNAPPDEQQESIAEFMNNHLKMAELEKMIRRVPTRDDVAMYKSGNVAGLGIGQ